MANLVNVSRGCLTFLKPVKHVSWECPVWCFDILGLMYAVGCYELIWRDTRIALMVLSFTPSIPHHSLQASTRRNHPLHSFPHGCTPQVWSLGHHFVYLHTMLQPSSRYASCEPL